MAAQPSHLQHNCGADGANPSALPDVGPASLHLGLFLGMPHPRRIDYESPALGVFRESPSEPGVEGVGFHHRGGEIVDRQVTGYSAEEGPGRLRPGDDLLQLLALLGADGTVPEVAQHDDHVPHRLAASRLRVMGQAQAGEISLGHLSRRGVSIRTVIVPSLRQFRFRMKRGRDGYDTEQPRLASSSWIRVICSRSCPGVPDCRGLDRLTLASRLSCSSSASAHPGQCPPPGRGHVLVHCIPGKTGSHVDLPLAVSRLPTTNDFLHFYCGNLPVRHRCTSNRNCGNGRRSGSHSGLMTLKIWEEGLEKFLVYWTIVPEKRQLDPLSKVLAGRVSTMQLTEPFIAVLQHYGIATLSYLSVTAAGGLGKDSLLP